MYPSTLKIEKKLKEVKLWVHPDGAVVGHLFVRTQSTMTATEEDPAEILNLPEPFVVLRRQMPEEIRFYNKSSIVRVEYEGPPPLQMPDIQPMDCTLQMMDGSRIQGTIRRPLPADRARLIDYLNLSEERFVKVEAEDGLVYLVNKPYIVCAMP